MRIVSLPAGSGDAFFVIWGNPERCLIIDAGRSGCYADSIKPLLQDKAKAGLQKIELALATHIDEDHMEGFIALVSDTNRPLEISDFWFNGTPHVEAINNTIVASVTQAEHLSQCLLKNKFPWNNAFGKNAIVTSNTKDFPFFDLAGGMRITILGPGPGELSTLAKHWQNAVKKQTLLAEILLEAKKKSPATLPLRIDQWSNTWTHDDVGPANLSSIVCLLEYKGKSALFTGDADPTIVVSAWKRLAKERGQAPKLNLLKLNHHGSKKNCSPELISLLRPKHVLISSDGSIYGHPEKEALATIIKQSEGVELIFNYDNEYSRPWLDNAEKKRWGFTSRAGENGKVEIVL